MIDSCGLLKWEKWCIHFPNGHTEMLQIDTLADRSFAWPIGHATGKACFETFDAIT
jgi:hypothetical protein